MEEEIKVPGWAEKISGCLKSLFKGMDAIGLALMSSPIIKTIWHGFIGGVMLLVIGCVKYSETGIELVQVPTIHAMWMAGWGGVIGMFIGWFSRGKTPPKVDP